MIKKLFLYIFLIFFIANVQAKEIVIECKYKKYKSIFKNSGDVIMSTKKKGEPKWVNWCPDEKNEDNKHWFVSAKNRNLIVGDLKGACSIEKGEFLKKNNKVGFVRYSSSVIDFKKLTYNGELFWMNESKKRKRKEKCNKNWGTSN